MRGVFSLSRERTCRCIEGRAGMAARTPGMEESDREIPQP